MGPGWLLQRGSRLRKVLAALAAPVLATLAMLLLPHVGVATAALGYVLAVAVASLVGGLVWGSVAALLSFAALHYAFTPPEGFAAPGIADLVALMTFLVVSILIGAMVSVIAAQRIRSERSAREARLMHEVSAGLLAGGSLEEMLRRFARSATDLLGLDRCAIVVGPVEVAVTAGSAGATSGTSAGEEFAMTARGRRVGAITATPADDHRWGQGERHTMRICADQLALAIDDARLGVQVKAAEMRAATHEATAALFSSVTHDLRTPLASILASATSLRDLGATFDAQDRSVLLDAICQEADRLNRLVGQILDMSKIRAGELHPDRVPASLEEVVIGVVTRLERTLQAREVVVDIQPDLPEVALDVLQIDRVLTNLLENAARFSPDGAPITISVASTDGRVRVETTDRGPGIEPTDREGVFEPFVGSREARPHGAGLGLAICRAIVEAHGGRIWIDEPAEQGARVVFELPTGPER